LAITWFTDPFPERQAGGYSRRDGGVDFFSRVSALVDEQSRVLDFGCGRGLSEEDPVLYRRRLQNFRGRVAWVDGVDVDTSVTANVKVDRLSVVAPESVLPIANSSVDLVLADWVLEHVANPSFAVDEFARVLKPGGWFCARTTNSLAPVALFARLIPNRLHYRVVSKLQPESVRKDGDVFPTMYRVNSSHAVKEYFDAQRWLTFTWTFRNEPAYWGSSNAGRRLGHVVEKVLPAHTRYVFAQRK
jgi:SAM-dependent methyltransferase